MPETWTSSWSCHHITGNNGCPAVGNAHCGSCQESLRPIARPFVKLCTSAKVLLRLWDNTLVRYNAQHIGFLPNQVSCITHH
ncbi:putative monoterpene synthase [Dirofilaria immitis]